MINTTIYIGLPEFYNTVQWPVALKILNAYDYGADKYFGVVLKSRSLLAGSRFVSFSEPGVNDGKSTVLSANPVSVSGDFKKAAKMTRRLKTFLSRSDKRPARRRRLQPEKVHPGFLFSDLESAGRSRLGVDL